MKAYALIFCFVIFLNAFAKKSAAQNDAKFVANQRVQQILSIVDIADAGKRLSVEHVLGSHFDSLNKVIAIRKAAMNEAVAKSANKELAEARSQAAWNAAAGNLNKLHATFLGKLSSLLTVAEMEKVKDAMTEGGLKAEYGRFLELLPNISEHHKAQVIAYLQEAREAAMDAETADNRRQWFIKFRGRANNYLAAAGYDLRKATADLEKRKAAKSNSPSIK